MSGWGSPARQPWPVPAVQELGALAVLTVRLLSEASALSGGGGQRRVLIEQFTHLDGQSEISAAVAALPNGRAPRGQKTGRVEATQKGWLHAEQVRGQTHGLGGIVLASELVLHVLRWCHLNPRNRDWGPGRRPLRGGQDPAMCDPVSVLDQDRERSSWAALTPSGWGYHRVVRSLPGRVVAVRERNAPAPPVSQSAAITSLRRKQHRAVARQTL